MQTRAYQLIDCILDPSASRVRYGKDYLLYVCIGHAGSQNRRPQA